MQDDAFSLPRTAVPANTRTLVPRASFLDTILLAADVILPTLAKGVIVRRRRVLELAERLDLDRRAIRRMQRLRDRYGSEPLLFRILGRRLAIVFRPEDVHRILEDTPVPFAAASCEKAAALSHLAPKGVLISSGPDRADRRRFNEEVLETHRPVHHLAESFLGIVHSEADRIQQAARQSGELTWDMFSECWFRMVRRVVFGETASEDHELSATTYQLRSAANWAFLRPQRTDLRRRFLNRIARYLRQAEPGSLAEAASHIATTERTAPEQQVPQWLFAFDPAGMTTFRSLALLATHPDEAAIVQMEVDDGDKDPFAPTPYLRATVLESLRLWPTTPLLLRETTADTEWERGVIPARTAVLIYTPFLHRDNQRLSYADRFAPEVWLDEHTAKSAPLIPFSEGPAGCPGRELVLFLSTAMISAILRRFEICLAEPTRLRADAPLPATLSHFGLRFAVKE